MKKLLLFVLFIMIISCKKKEENMESIHEKTFIEINGARIGMFIIGNNKNGPVLLFLHGGPALPEYGMTKKYPTRLEENFIVCWYEQRGAGISYDKNVDYKQVTVENIVLDTVEIANYLRNRFKQDKIYLMGHSWGTLIGLKTIKKTPELFYAYIGIAQVVNQLKSEKLAYEYMIEKYKQLDNERMVKKLEKFNLPPLDAIPIDYVPFRDKPMHELGIGSMHKMKSVISVIFIPIIINNEYTFSERINIWKTKSICLKKTDLWETISKTDLSAEIDSIDTPIYFFHGIL
jgi:pimeloyl-ACP methyl ester carboxylesterase